jgi:hypothetical protein
VRSVGGIASDTIHPMEKRGAKPAGSGRSFDL